MLKHAITILLSVAAALVVLVAAAVPGVVAVLLGRSDSATASRPSQAALSDIPHTYLPLYQQAATTCRGLDWSILAAIGKIETNHGQSNLPGVHNGENPAGAAGPMQFLQSTFTSVIARHPIPPGGSGPPSRYNTHDAIHAAAHYLCDSGVRDGDLRRAIFAYNHAGWYMRQVLNQASEYRRPLPLPALAGGWVAPTQGRCSSGFGTRGGEFHAGQDIAAPLGTSIVAASSGTVIDAGPASGYGLWIRIRHSHGVITTYGHNHHNLVHVGQQVHAGQIIAKLGNRGESTGPHLHFQVEVHGQPIDPIVYYQRRSAPSPCI